VLDHGIDESSRIPFITMELLEGESLEARLRRKGCLPPAETLEIISQLVRGLSRAHEAGVVHRDLKPENVFLVRNDEQSLVKVLDFGIAKGSRASLAARLTRPGRVLGTPFYMSPEQFRGSREIDHRADLWSLSAITCECLTGRRPFEAKDIGELALLLIRNSGRPLPSDLGTVPPGFDAWFQRATHSEIEQRFQSARELGAALARVCGGVRVQQAGAVAPTEELAADGSDNTLAPVQLRSGLRLRWTPARVAGFSLLVSLPIAVGAFWQYQRHRAARSTAEPAVAALASAPEVATLALRPAPPKPAADTLPAPVALPSPADAPQAPGAGAQASAASDPSDPSAVGDPSAVSAANPATPPAHTTLPGPAARSVRHEGTTRQPGKPTRRGRTPRSASVAPAGTSTLVPVDVNGRAIRMTLDPLQ
jgi:serine/threonine-protein kinase